MKVTLQYRSKLFQASSNGPQKLISHRLLSANSISTSHHQRQQPRSPLLLHRSFSRSLTPTTTTTTVTGKQFHHPSSPLQEHSSHTRSVSTTAAAMDATDDLAERIETQASSGQGKKGGGGGSSKKGGASAGAGGAQKKEKDISRALSRLLRHQATNAGITLDAEGYAPLDKVVSGSSLLFFFFFHERRADKIFLFLPLAR